MDIRKFKALPIMGILRGIDADILEPVVETIASSGLETVEITMNTTDCSGLLQKMVKLAQGRFMVGAGTVLSMDELHSAIDSGAGFIVLPTLIEEVVDYCVKRSIPVFPGALTPQEIYNAWSAGATMVKVFPAKFFGPAYFKEIKGPFQDIELLACGGVGPDTIAHYFNNGASAVAFGASIFKQEWLDSGQFSKIGDSIKTLIAAKD